MPLLEQAASGYERLGFRLDHARTLTQLGGALRRCKRRRDGRAALEQAIAICEQIGSPGWERQARDELDRLGGRRASGDELTATEERVARLVAGGRRNREVASELFVSVAAVEANLSRIYGKLGIRSRTELARRLADLDAA